MEGRTLDYIALGMLIFVCITFVYGIIYIHDIPYEMAKKRNHPHQDAIHTAGWVSLFLMHTIWPFLWIWATLYKPGYGWGFHHDARTDAGGEKKASPLIEAEALEARIAMIENDRLQEKDAYVRQIAELTARVTQLEGQVRNEEEQ